MRRNGIVEIDVPKDYLNKAPNRETDRRLHREYLLAIGLGVTFALSLLFYGWQHYQWIQYGYRIEEAEKKKEDAAEMSRRLRLERASLRNPQRIDDIARNQLGMVAPAPGQVVMLHADAPMELPFPGSPQTTQAVLLTERR